ncbi:lysine N(6)-hydroxylase/L-ornithine N(5)-oxygenase family protein [Alkalibacillus silvisoli]|uniref:L-lysine N6-monooxygenase MbtG n=1 Tax=Alkalibacillus silvisoli TaxID=392823 RepID=A0ABN1A4V4_9BACI
MQHKLYTFIGIGIGPYNLGLAALTEDLEDVDRIFFDQTPQMDWHPGMLIEGTDLQIPFLADLVTFANPKSRYSFLNYLHEHGRLYKFYFFQKMEIPRQEYNDYLQWATDQISGLIFGQRVVDIIDHQDAETPHYEVVIEDQETMETSRYFTKHVVMATGSEPFVLDSTENLREDDVLHTSRYLYYKEQLLNSNHITIVGSGQSAAEVFYDLLEERENKEFHLTWFTRSKGIFQLESAKIGQEFFSPKYVDYFHQLDFEKRKETLDSLDPLRHGVDESTLEGIYDMLYHYSIGEKDPKVTIQPITDVKEIKPSGEFYEIQCEQWQQEESFNYQTEKVILATGYKPNIPQWFLERFENKIHWEDREDLLFKITRHYRLDFKQERDHHFYMVTNIEHSHGTAATNLGLAIQRNMEIINDLLGKEVYQAKGHSIFQQFQHDT